jgi:hypothetical protein
MSLILRVNVVAFAATVLIVAAFILGRRNKTARAKGEPVSKLAALFGTTGVVLAGVGFLLLRDCVVVSKLACFG